MTRTIQSMTRAERRVYARAVNHANLAIIAAMYSLTAVAVCAGLAL